MPSQFNFSILFWLNHSKAQNDLAPIYARITVNGRRSEISLQRHCSSKLWDKKIQRMKGRSPEAQKLNSYLDRSYAKLVSCHEEILREDEFLTSSAIKSRFLGKSSKAKTLLDILTYHKEHMQEVLKYGTLKNYKATEKYLKSFLKSQYKNHDIYLKRISYEFVSGFDRFLRKQKNAEDHPQLSNNGVMKHMQRFKKLMNLAIKLDWLKDDPFQNYTMRFEKFDRDYLTRSELSLIEDLFLEKEYLEVTRDVFLFACYTGLSYIDVKLLTLDNIIEQPQGRNYIHYCREKSHIPVKIPLLEKPQAILDKYLIYSRTNTNLLPVFSNQKVNKYLKEIKKLCEIKKTISFHVARHTFATTITLSNGVPIETVSKLLGHTKLSTTQIYARVIDNKITEDMEHLQIKMNRSDK